MGNLLTTIISIFLIVSVFSCGRAPKSVDNGIYIVDGSVKSKVNKKVKASGGFAFGSMDFKMFENDKSVGGNQGKGKSVGDCLTSAFLDGDTIRITGYLGKTAEFGYQITLMKDTSIVRYFTKADAEIYKYRRSDPPGFSITIPCKNHKLTLASQPAFKQGEIVEGIIELTSDDFYQAGDGKESKYRMELMGYFRTQPLASMEDYYEKMRRKYNK